jgi:hypothetical protein
MIRVIIGNAVAFALVSSTVLASGGATHPHQSTRVEVTPAGAFYRTDDRVPDARPSDGPATPQASGLIWTKTDGGLMWQANAVSIGNFGSEVFTEYDVFNQQDQLFSVFDSNPPTALWTDPTSASATRVRHVATANTSRVYVSIHANASGSATIVSKYSTTGTPDWTYVFPFGPPPNLDGGTGIGISRDGNTIVAATSNVNAGTADIAVFSPTSNVPLSYTTVNLGAAPNDIRGFDLSADGSTLYFAPGGAPTANIFDVASASIVFSTPIGASFESHAISGDGSVFAFGNFNTMKVWERTGTLYTNTFTRTVPGSNYCDKIDISDDSKTIAYGYTFYDHYLTVRIEALDVPTHTVTMTDIVTATGNLQNIVSGVSCSADGQRFAVGLWGDGTGPVAEARLYKKNQNAAIGTVNLNGSVFSIAISADGQRLVAGSKAVHANTFGGGGEVDLFGDATPFTNYCFGNGSLSTACPCGNNGLIGHGCDNSRGTGGALLTANGTVSPDTVVLTSSQELVAPLNIFLQGQISITSGVVFGDGVRCVDGNLKRLYTTTASGGTAIAPGSGDPSITARSAALGDTITPGTSRFYQAYYRDPVLTFCPSPTGDEWNVSNAVKVDW